MNVDKTPLKIEKMFDKIACNYDFMNNIISFFSHYSIKSKALDYLNIKNNSKVLDLCAGSGDMGRIVLKKSPKSKVAGVDFSSKMIEIAQNKNKNIEYFIEDATNLSFENESFDYVICAFGLRNIQDRKRCLSEIYRVLKPQGKFLHLDFGEKNFISKIYDFILNFIIQFLKNKEAYYYLIESKNEFPCPIELAEEFELAGFKKEVVKYFFFKNISFQIVKK